jgi:hypothetical protein
MVNIYTTGFLKKLPFKELLDSELKKLGKVIERMDSSRIPNNLLNYRPHGKRSLGRPLKRWSETITGHLA